MSMTPTQPPAGGLVSLFSRSRTNSGRLLIVLGVILGALAAWLGYRSGAANLPLTVWVGALAAGAVVVGWWLAFGAAEAGREDESGRLAVLMLAFIAGGATFVLGLALLYSGGEAVVKLITQGDRTNAWGVLGALTAIVGGLAVMFVGLQVVRSEERRSLILRRAVYGFNAFLTGFLLLAVLVVVNVVAVLKLPAAIDATRSGSFTLSDSTLKLLAAMDRPLKAYLIYGSSEEGFVAYDEMRSLLRLAQERTPLVTVEEFNLTRPGQQAAIRDLLKKYPLIPTADPEGLLLVYGEEKTDNAGFIRLRDLISQEGSPMGRDVQVKFLGEVKFGTELSFLMGGREKTLLYFTQGAGEPDLSDSFKKGGLGRLKERLEKRNFEVKPLNFEPIDPKVPDDAKVLVVVNPARTLSPAQADAVKAYLDRGGKLVALFDVPADTRSAKTMPPTGLESVLAANGVEVTTDRILSVVGIIGAVSENPEVIVARVTTTAGDNPVASLFRGFEIPFDGVRQVRPAASPEPSLTVSPLFGAMPPVWAESDLQANGTQISKLMLDDPKERSRLARGGLPFVVAVSARPPAMPGAPRVDAKPKLIVFGDATFVGNELLNERGASTWFDLFASSVEWLRERPANIGIEPRVYHTYEMRPEAAQPDHASRLIWMPLAVAVVVVAGLGTGVWLVRRQ